MYFFSNIGYTIRCERTSRLPAKTDSLMFAHLIPIFFCCRYWFEADWGLPFCTFCLSFAGRGV